MKPAPSNTRGERALIAAIRARLPQNPSWLPIGIGDDAAVAEPERGALEILTTDALVEAFKTAAGTEFRVGLINALAKKNGSAVVETLTVATKDGDPEVRIAAAEALAENPDPAHDLVLASLEFGGLSRFESRAARARIRLGNTLVRAGRKDAADSVFAAVARAEVAEPQQKAAQAATK